MTAAVTDSADPHGLARFVQAQEVNYASALAELRAGRKRSHWSWYVLPQVRGLGLSPMSQRYAIASLDEARAYLAHPILGPRLRDCVAAMNAHRADSESDGSGLSAEDILGGTDAQKFRSCLTLFIEAGAGDEFTTALKRYFGGKPDAATLGILGRS